MKYREKVKDYRLVVTARAGFGEKIDEFALNKFNWSNVSGFMKAMLVRRNCIEYTGSMGSSLEEYLRQPMKGYDFLFLMEQISLVIRSVMDNKLSQSKVLLDVQYAYVNNVTRELQLLYVPADSVNFSNGIMTFLDAIIARVRPDTEQDRIVISDFQFFLRRLNCYDPDRVERYIASVDPSVFKTLGAHHTGTSRKLYKNDWKEQQLVPDMKSDASKTMVDILDGDDTALIQENYGYPDDDATGVLEEYGNGLPTGLLMDEEDDVPTDLLVQDDEDIPTSLLVEEPPQNFPKLYRPETKESIVINKAIFRIGRKASSSDYRVTNNDNISGKHVDIYNRNGTYFVVDLGSKNHTYINEQMLTPGDEIELLDGDRLRLANEVFVFNM